MAPGLITPAHAAALTAAYTALSAAHDGAGTDRPDWWQGVANAHQYLADTLDTVARAAGKALGTAWDAPEHALIEVVYRAAFTHREQAKADRAKQAEIDAYRARRDQDRAYASYADNITAAGVGTGTERSGVAA